VTTKYSKTAPSASAALLLAALLAGCASSTDGFVEEGSDTGAIDTNAVKAIMTGLGAIDPHEKQVEYRPRAPLVVPPKRDLRRPLDADATTPARFPRNPEDVAEEQRRAALDNDQPGKDGRVMTPDELARYAIPGAGQSRRYEENPGRKLTPQEMAGQAQVNAEAIKRAENPAGRRTLIEPPDGYRKPSPNAPVAAPEEKSSWKPSWWPL
jgi:hypothetical protein